ncbi:hypothetical protein [Nonomuraea typhae]|uniref:Head-to-tail stopper n=1 Tax=Nonomuraea typhae TaxID=2603600 RepID=A0ABW7YQZ0_9ACTN
MIPDRLLPLTLTLVRPAQRLDRYNDPTFDYGDAATRTTFRGWIDQSTANEQTPDSRNTITGTWALITNRAGIDANDHIDWDGAAYELDGPPWPVHTPAGVHHYEAKLRHVEG